MNPTKAVTIGGLLVAGVFGLETQAADVLFEDLTDTIVVKVDNNEVNRLKEPLGIIFDKDGKTPVGIEGVGAEFPNAIPKGQEPNQDIRHYFALTDPGGGNDKKGDISDIVIFGVDKGSRDYFIEIVSDPIPAELFKKGAVFDTFDLGKAEETGGADTVPLPGDLPQSLKDAKLTVKAKSDLKSDKPEPKLPENLSVEFTGGMLAAMLLAASRRSRSLNSVRHSLLTCIPSRAARKSSSPSAN